VADPSLVPAMQPNNCNCFSICLPDVIKTEGIAQNYLLELFTSLCFFTKFIYLFAVSSSVALQANIGGHISPHIPVSRDVYYFCVQSITRQFF
jgi:hypothetical protein